MFLCTLRLPSFRPRPCASRASANQNVAGVFTVWLSVAQLQCYTVCYTVTTMIYVPVCCAGPRRGRRCGSARGSPPLAAHGTVLEFVFDSRAA